MKLPQNFDEATIILEPDKRPILQAMVSRKIPFPTSNKRSILLYGPNGTGKTLLASMLPILIEYERADAKEKQDYDFCYKYKGDKISITPDNSGKEKIEAVVEIMKCTPNSKKQLAQFEEMIGYKYQPQLQSDLQFFIFDEADKLEEDQQFLQSIIDTEYPFVIFIMTTNKFEDIEKPILSRSHHLFTDFVNTKDMLNIAKRSYDFGDIDEKDLINILNEAEGDLRHATDICEELKFTLSSTDSGK